jgi:hypothetical protein
MTYMKKRGVLFLLIFSVLTLSAQEIPEKDKILLSTEEDEIIDNILGDDIDVDQFLKSISSFQFLYFSVDYNTKSYFSGRDIGTDQFNINPQITYIHSSGFFVGVNGVYYSEFTPKWDYTSLTAGYGQSFGKNKSYNWTSSYASYFYSDGVDNPFTNAISFGLETTNKKKTLGTELTTTYLFGNDTSFQLISSNYGIVNLSKTKEYQLRLRPELNIVIAQQTIQLARTVTVRGKQFTRKTQKNDFGLINTQLQIPLQLNVGGFDFELGYVVNFPTALEGETGLGITNNINFSVSYLLGF